MAVNIGEGSLNIKGSYDTNTSSGNADFNGTISKIPTPLLSKSFEISGSAVKKGKISDIQFSAQGDSISGNGSITIREPDNVSIKKDSDISGTIELKVGMLPLKLRLSGSLNNIKLSVGT